MEPTASLRLPIQSPPISRGHPAGHGHQHPGGIHAAQCERMPDHQGTCTWPDNFRDYNKDCESCCSENGLRWVSNINPRMQTQCYWVPGVY